MVSAWRNFKNIFCRPLFTIIFRPEMLKFRPYSILTMDTRVKFVIYGVLRGQGVQIGGDLVNCKSNTWKKYVILLFTSLFISLFTLLFTSLVTSLVTSLFDSIVNSILFVLCTFFLLCHPSA